MLDKCPECGAPRFDVSAPVVLLHFDCGSSWEPNPLKCWNQTMACKDGRLAALAKENERLKKFEEVATEIYEQYVDKLANKRTKPFHPRPGTWVKLMAAMRTKEQPNDQ